MIHNKILFSIVVIGLFFVFSEMNSLVYNLFENGKVGYLAERCLRVVMIFAATILFFKPREVFMALGVKKGTIKGMLIAALCTTPMFFGYAFFGTLSQDLTLLTVAQKALIPGFYEEILFRAFLFGLLFRFCNWGFVPAALLNALVFGSVHLYQASDLSTAMTVFAVTGMGGMWFAWLYIEWDNNLWVAIFLHVFMNAAWSIFSIADNAAGGLHANIFRIITITISVVLTIYIIKKRGYRNIGLKQLFYNKKLDADMR